MNIEIANHLVQLRKKNGYSQEALAEKLGLSRQAVSKWERAEASPDTENLIALAKLYGVTLDQLLLMGEKETGEEDLESGAAVQNATDEKKSEKKEVHISFKKGIHVIDGDEEVHVAPGLVYVKESGEEKVNIAKDHIFVRGKEEKAYGPWLSMPFPFIATAAFFILGFGLDAWHPGWLVFLTIPLYYTLLDAIIKREPNHFAFPVLAALIYLCMGIFAGWWAWGWLIFLTVPIYYCTFPGKKDNKADGD